MNDELLSGTLACENHKMYPSFRDRLQNIAQNRPMQFVQIRPEIIFGANLLSSD